jgi:CRISPR-associated endonuclease/helicase Cas3
MANSVIIFDEVQSLPIKCVSLFNGALNFLSGVCNSTILLCTATQPLLETVARPVRLHENASIVDCRNSFSAPERTKLVDACRPGGYSTKDLAQFVTDKFNGSTLVILNTKRTAKKLFGALKNCGIPTLHLSKYMCNAHLAKVISEVRDRIDKKLPVICISTQLIEAGVDISFECVIRGIAGLDSIYQAAGRCNRNGEYGELKSVYIVNVAGENLDMLPDIKKGAEVTFRLLNEGSPDIDKFYKYYFCERKSEMDYNRPNRAGGTLYDLLSDNKQGCNAYKNRGKTDKIGLRPAIRTAGDEFCVIERGQTEVIVIYGEADALIERYRAKRDTTAKRRLLRKLGKYTVSLYDFQLRELRTGHALDENREDGLIILSRDYYDANLGVNI